MQNSNSPKKDIVDFEAKRSKRIQWLANRLLNTDDATLERFFKKSESISIDINSKKEIFSIYSFSWFAQRVRTVLENGRIEDFTKLCDIRQDIKNENHLTQADIELLEKYGLRHWN
jgi:hypothetical protein